LSHIAAHPLFFSTEPKNPLADARVRRALTMAVNTQTIIDVAYDGAGLPARGPLGPNMPHSPHNYVTPLPFDPDAARALLAEAGFADGFSLTIAYNLTNTARGMVAEVLQTYWADIGVELNIYGDIEWETYLDMTAQSFFNAFMLRAGAGMGETNMMLRTAFHSGHHGWNGNRSHFSNNLVDDLLEQARTSLDQDEKNAIYHQITEILIYEAPWIFISHPKNFWITTGITGLEVNINNSPCFYNVRFLEVQ